MRVPSSPSAWSLATLSLLVAGCGSDSPTTPPTPPPTSLTAPANVVATATSPTAVQVSFGLVTGTSTYVIERAQGTTGAFTSAGTTTTSPFADAGLTSQTLYRYRVAAQAGTAQSPFSSEATVTTPSSGPTIVPVTQDITANTTWTANNVYLLQGFIHVTNGATLTIEPGTVIQGDFNTLGSSLFVLRGARIVANGTAAAPIVFTSSRPAGQRQAGDWGGLIVIGNGIINRADPIILEGSGTNTNNNVPVVYSGGTDNTDNSGTLRFVRVEFAGFGPAPDTELNSFTFAAVGSGTTFDHLESLNGLDDAYEFFGGAVNATHLVSYNSGDDHFDMSEGYVGRLQFLIAYQSRTVIPRPTAGNISSDPQGIENDGCNGSNCTNGQDSAPLTIPLVANFTLVGPPASVTSSSGQIGMMLRRGTGGFYVNGVVARWSRASVSLRDQTTLNREAAGDLVLRNILFAESPVIFQAQTGSTVQGSVNLAANALEDQTANPAAPLFTLLPAGEPSGVTGLDWTPASGSAIATGGLNTFSGAIATKAGTFVTPTSYRGAADPSGAKWWQGWTNFAVN